MAVERMERAEGRLWEGVKDRKLGKEFPEYSCHHSESDGKINNLNLVFEEAKIS